MKKIIISEGYNNTINAGATRYFPSESGATVEAYLLKTIFIEADYAMQFKIEVKGSENDTWSKYYPSSDWKTLTADKLEVLSFEEDVYKVRITVYNPDTSAHTLKKYIIRGGNP